VIKDLIKKSFFVPQKYKKTYVSRETRCLF